MTIETTVESSIDPRTLTRAESAPVPSANATKEAAEARAAFKALDGKLDSLAGDLIYTIDQMIPHLDKMQALLSQRGADRKKVLRDAGLPSWTVYAAKYANRLHSSVRTIQDRITQYRRGDGSAKREAKKNSPLKLNNRQQSALVRAALAGHNLVSALKHGHDFHTALAEYEKVAVSPSKLDTFLDPFAQEPDWHAVLVGLLDVLQKNWNELPISVLKVMEVIHARLLKQPPEKTAFSDNAATGASEPLEMQERGRTSHTAGGLSETPVSANENQPTTAATGSHSNFRITQLLPLSQLGTILTAYAGNDSLGMDATHHAVAALAEKHPDWTDQKLAEATDCTITEVRQALVRFRLGKVAA